MIELQELCSIITCSTRATVNLYDNNNLLLIAFNIEGYESLDDELLTRTVTKLQILSDKSISITLAEESAP